MDTKRKKEKKKGKERKEERKRNEEKVSVNNPSLELGKLHTDPKQDSLAHSGEKILHQESRMWRDTELACWEDGNEQIDHYTSKVLSNSASLSFIDWETTGCTKKKNPTQMPSGSKRKKPREF